MLVVDDEPQIVRGLRVILTNAGYRVEEATTKQEALDAVSVRPPDAIVLDLILPDGDGVEVADGNQALEPGADRRALGRRRRAPEGACARRRG